MSRWIDLYSLRARLAPGLLVLFPAIVLVFVWQVDNLWNWSAFWSTAVASGVVMALTFAARSRGRALQDGLFAEWGGSPTLRRLRHRDTVGDPGADRRRRQLQALVPDLEMPTAEQEADSPAVADKAYEAFTRVLRDQTRDRRRFPLIFDDLCNFGFARNAFGLRPLGMTVSSAAIVGSAVRCASGALGSAASPEAPMAGVIGLFLSGCTLFWWSRMSSHAVRQVAEGYAEHLLGALDNLVSAEALPTAESAPSPRRE